MPCINNITLTLLLISIASLPLTSQAQRPCLEKSYGIELTVCVCNENYCDETPKISKLSPDQYFIYESSLRGMRGKTSLGPLEFSKDSGNGKKIT